MLDSRTPALGAKVVARAWVDPGFRARLIADGRAGCEELGISFYDDTQLIVLENTQEVHNLIVCTLCRSQQSGLSVWSICLGPDT